MGQVEKEDNAVPRTLSISAGLEAKFVKCTQALVFCNG